MPAGEFKAKCLKIFEEARSGNLEVTVTKRGIPVGTIVMPKVVKNKKKSGAFGCMKGTMEIIGDIEEDLSDEWNLEKYDDLKL